MSSLKRANNQGPFIISLLEVDAPIPPGYDERRRPRRDAPSAVQDSDISVIIQNMDVADPINHWEKNTSKVSEKTLPYLDITTILLKNFRNQNRNEKSNND